MLWSGHTQCEEEEAEAQVPGGQVHWAGGRGGGDQETGGVQEQAESTAGE